MAIRQKKTGLCRQSKSPLIRRCFPATSADLSKIVVSKPQAAGHSHLVVKRMPWWCGWTLPLESKICLRPDMARSSSLLILYDFVSSSPIMKMKRFVQAATLQRHINMHLAGSQYALTAAMVLYFYDLVCCLSGHLPKLMRLGLRLLLKVLPVMLLAQRLQCAVNSTHVSKPSMTTSMISWWTTYYTVRWRNPRCTEMKRILVRFPVHHLQFTFGFLRQVSSCKPRLVDQPWTKATWIYGRQNERTREVIHFFILLRSSRCLGILGAQPQHKIADVARWTWPYFDTEWYWCIVQCDTVLWYIMIYNYIHLIYHDVLSSNIQTNECARQSYASVTHVYHILTYAPFASRCPDSSVVRLLAACLNPQRLAGPGKKQLIWQETGRRSWRKGLLPP